MQMHIMLSKDESVHNTWNSVKKSSSSLLLCVVQSVGRSREESSVERFWAISRTFRALARTFFTTSIVIPREKRYYAVGV